MHPDGDKTHLYESLDGSQEDSDEILRMVQSNMMKQHCRLLMGWHGVIGMAYKWSVEVLGGMDGGELVWINWQAMVTHCWQFWESIVKGKMILTEEESWDDILEETLLDDGSESHLCDIDEALEQDTDSEVFNEIQML